PVKKITLPIKGIVSINVEVKNALLATEKIISELEKHEIEDKIVLLRVRGILESGKTSDIKFSQIEEAVKRKNAYFLLRNTHELKAKEEEIEIQVGETENIEEETIKLFSDQNTSNFNKHISQLMDTFVAEKQEGETTENFTNRLLDDAKKILNF
ncbi:MAG: hypothetical protein KJ879_01165, partial [Nanoarchaeota archaeon]|nr:hypothetical protein [Nanoarchaeota archaeon]